MTKVKNRLALISIVVAGVFAMPAVASADYGMHSYEAQAQGNNVGYSRCINEPGFNPPWSCFAYYGSQVLSGDGTYWRVESDFTIATPQGGRRSCYVITHWHAWMLGFIYASPGC